MLSESTPNSEERERLIAVLFDTRCIASPRLEHGFGKPVPEEAELMADAVLAAGYRPQEAERIHELETYLLDAQEQLAERDAVLSNVLGIVPDVREVDPNLADFLDHDILDAAPASVLAEVKAQAWSEGKVAEKVAAHAREVWRISDTSDPKPRARNPYRKESNHA